MSFGSTRDKARFFLLAAVVLAFFVFTLLREAEEGNLRSFLGFHSFSDGGSEGGSPQGSIVEQSSERGDTSEISAPTSEEPPYAFSSSRPIEPPVQSAESVYIKVPFTSQAPYGVWDVIHEETCEEAAILMARAWMYDLPLTKENVEYELQKIVQWENLNFGTFENTSAAETALIAKRIYGMDARLIDRPTIDDIKRELRNNSVIAMGLAGRELQNPHFTPPGPVYHMIVIRGYDANGFFANDPGTYRGENFYYPFNIIEEAAHDWSGSQTTLSSSPARAIVFSKNE